MLKLVIQSLKPGLEPVQLGDRVRLQRPDYPQAFTGTITEIAWQGYRTIIFGDECPDDQLLELLAKPDRITMTNLSGRGVPATLDVRQVSRGADVGLDLAEEGEGEIAGDADEDEDEDDEFDEADEDENDPWQGGAD